ncbi:MAG: hypothetical protein V7761_09420 [Amylibacter sp.]
MERRLGEMLLPLDAGKANASEKLGAIIDNINGRFGTSTVKYGINKPQVDTWSDCCNTFYNQSSV